MSEFNLLNRKARRRDQALARQKAQRNTSKTMARIALHSAIAAGVSGLGYSRQAYAGSCTSTAPDTYVCTGAASSTGVDNGQSIRGTDVVVTSAPNFGIDNSNNANSLDALNVIADDSISISVSGPLTGNLNGIRALNYGYNNGSLTVTTSGLVTGESGDGIYARNGGLLPDGITGADLTINVVDVSGSANGIYARNDGTGDLSITADGQVLGGEFGDGIFAFNSATGGDLTISATSSTGGHDGIDARNYGTGDVSVTAIGDLISGDDVGDRGVEVRNSSAGGAVDIDVANIVAEDSGVLVNSQGTGDLNISSSGDVTSTGSSGGTGGPGFEVEQSGTGDITITASGEVRSNVQGFDVEHSGSGDVTITAEANVTTGSTGVEVRHTGATGSVNITTQADVYSRGSNGIFASNDSSGALAISSAGTVTGSTDFGIAALNSGTDLSIDLINATGDNAGVIALNSGVGDLSISSSGTILSTGAGGTGGGGIYARNYGVNLTIDTNVVTGPDFGIDAYNMGSGELSITATGAVTSFRGRGVFAFNSASGTDLSIDVAGGVTSRGEGVFAQNRGEGDLSIVSSGAIASTDSGGIYALNSDSGADLTITASSVSSVNAQAINAQSRGSGALSIAATGAISSTYGTGVFAQNYGTDLTISTSEVAADGVGVLARNRGSGEMVVTATGTVSGNTYDGMNLFSHGTDLTISIAAVSGGQNGISARSYGSGALTISATDVTGVSDYGINARNYSDGTDLAIITTGAINGETSGIRAANFGSGALTISAADVTGTSYYGINASNSANGTDLSITTTGVITGKTNGLSANNTGSGSLTISVADVTGKNGRGIIASNSFNGTDLSIDIVNDVTGEEGGVVALNQGTGDLSIISSGTITSTDSGGVFARSDGGNLTIDANAVVGDNFGIDAGNNGSGHLSITTRGTVSAVTTAINALNSGSGDLTITSMGAVTSELYHGIEAINTGASDVIIHAVGVSGGRDGIHALQVGSGSLNISTSGDIVGTTDGIDARNYGAGNTTITISQGSTVTGGSGAGIETRTDPSGLSVIDLQRGASVSATSGEAISNNEGDSQVTLGAGSTVVGAVRLNDGIDALTIHGGADITGATLFDGGVGLQDALTFSAFSGTFDNTLFSNWESLTADNGSSLDLNEATVDFGSIAAQNGSSVAVSDANFTLNGTLQIDGTSSFIANHAGAGKVTISGDVLNDGLIRLADGQSGDRFTVGGDLTGTGSVSLDVDFASGINDQLSVSGNTAGIQQGLQVQKSGGNAAAAQNITLATVSGSSTASDFQLEGDFVAKNGLDAVNAGAYAFFLDYDEASGEFFLTPFNADGSVSRNPDRAILAAGVQQFSDHLSLDGALSRLPGRTSGAGAETVSRSLIDLSTTDQPLIWLNAVGGRDSYTFEGRENETTSGGLRVGASLPLAEIGGGTLLGGLEFGVTSLSTTSETALADGKIDTDAYDLTLSALWLADNQLYLDGQLRYAYFDSTTRLAGGQEVDTDGDGFAASIEVGKIFALKNGLNLIPQAQLQYSDVDSDDLTDVTGGGTGTVSDGDTLSARLGLRAEHELIGLGVIFGQLDYIRAFDNDTSVTFGNDTILTERGKNNIALTLGGHIAMSERTTLFGEVSAQRGFDGGSDDHSYAGQIGFEFRF